MTPRRWAENAPFQHKSSASPSSSLSSVRPAAVAEALGYYFDAMGNCVYSASSVGVDLTRLSPSCQMVAVAAGRRKGQAMLAVLKRYRHAMLITDEGAAREILRLINIPS